jgi:hypothetical protein
MKKGSPKQVTRFLFKKGWFSMQLAPFAGDITVLPQSQGIDTLLE